MTADKMYIILEKFYFTVVLFHAFPKLAEFKFTAVFPVVNSLDFNFTGLFKLHPWSVSVF